jgi:hypothetical protein
MSLQAQEKKAFDNDLKLGTRTPVYVSYYGNMGVHPGIRAGFNWNIFMIEKTIEKKKKVKKIRKLFYVSPSLIYYNHIKSNKNLMLRVDADWRRYTKRLYFYDVGVGIGYLQRFNTGDTWEVKDDGSVSHKGGSSRAYFATAISFSFGKQVSLKNGNTLSPFIKIDTDYLAGYNSSILPEASIELGVMFIPKWGIKQGDIKVKTKSKNKKNKK